MREGADPLEQRAVETLRDTVQLRRVVHCQLARRARGREVRIECVAQVLASAIGAKDLDWVAVRLSECPCLK